MSGAGRGPSAPALAGRPLGWPSLLALVLIVLSPSDLNVISELGGARPEAQPARSRSASLLASAAYLDQVGQLSNVMSEFVDVLLEKVSFLAELLIESSLAEECAPFDCKLTGADRSAALAAARKPNWTISLDAKALDAREFTDADLFVGSLSGATSKPSARQGGCKLFTFALERRDLPIDGMESCCHAYDACYDRCAAPKLECDTEFRRCLGAACRRHFDYTDEEHLRRHHRRLGRRSAPDDSEPLAADDDGDLDSAAAGADQGDHRQDQAAAGDELRAEEDQLYAEVEKELGGAFRQAKRETARQQDKLASKYGAQTVRSLRSKYKACKLAGKLLVIGNLAFGCQAYKRSQWAACCSKAGADNETAAPAFRAQTGG